MSETGLHIDGRFHTKEELLTRAGHTEDEEPWLKDIWDTIAAWYDHSPTLRLQTSGSTGTPKIIDMPKEAMRRSARATLAHLQIADGGRFHLCIPAKYVGGKMMIIRAIVSNGMLTYESASSRPAVSTDGGSTALTALVPLQVQSLLANGSDDFKGLGSMIVGGAPLSYALLARLKEMDLPMWQTFGMTETSSHIALKRISGIESSDRFETIGGITVSANDRDCLQINAEAWGLGHLGTTDIVEIHSPSSFKWLGRADNVINTGGVKVHPEKVESILAYHIGASFFIHHRPDERLGQRVVICIEGQIRSGDLRDGLDALSTYERPKEIWSTTTFDRTETGKIVRSSTFEKCRLAEGISHS